MAGWMINCKENAALSSQGMERSLSLRERLLIKMHQWLCPPCNQIHKQFDAIRNACRKTSADGIAEAQTDNVLPEDACKRIKAAIKDLPL